MIIGSKARPNYPQMRAKQLFGSTHMEFHMEDEDVQYCLDNIEELKRVVNRTRQIVYCVHTPYNDMNNIELYLGNISKDRESKMIELTKGCIKIANELNTLSLPSVVVCHVGNRYDINQMRDSDFINEASIIENSIAKSSINELIEYIDNNKFNVKLGIENSPSVIIKDNVSNNFYRLITYREIFDFVDSIDSSKLGVVLDTCHMINSMIMRMNEDDIFYNNIIETLPSFDRVCLIHLSGFNSSGISYENHSICLKDIELNSYMLDRLLIKIGNHNIPITLEVNEKDLLLPSNFKESLSVASKVFC